MKKFKNALEIYQLLEKSNCKKCGERTCLAFAGKVFHEQLQIKDCPFVSSETANQYSGSSIGQLNVASNNVEQTLNSLKQAVAKIDLASIADEIGGKWSDDKLTIKVFGKAFYIHSDGNVTSDLHINMWVLAPLLTYVINNKKKLLSGEWVSFRNLVTGSSSYPLFHQRCEIPMSKIANSYTDLFEDMIHVFQGKQEENLNGSDISLVLYPLPKLPILIRYWKPDDEMESDFKFLFDSSADFNLDIEQINTICTGMALMFQKLSITHT